MVIKFIARMTIYTMDSTGFGLSDKETKEVYIINSIHLHIVYSKRYIVFVLLFLYNKLQIANYINDIAMWIMENEEKVNLFS